MKSEFPLNVKRKGNVSAKRKEKRRRKRGEIYNRSAVKKFNKANYAEVKEITAT